MVICCKGSTQIFGISHLRSKININSRYGDINIITVCINNRATSEDQRILRRISAHCSIVWGSWSYVFVESGGKCFDLKEGM